ncbi:endonuclease/exonuclease/phosphatase family protein [Neorhizobium galegae]|uniref:Endonuclease/exonuclease/phosphatase family protein n=1 Tax=Neorhizobium galegae bv. orientalis str. HAMBI 540 TaxID=1028800 RepID=A0A068ST92_NEOGA|nr:endonuclease/exonuclease/phosphatase family protein [Neorhizobium galegae]CDN49522.1 Endonuclease/exonuclease/phosphatase family protein [Neorhizobium galegae bv. orientalis str. HAMBI 540]CDZ46975.1 Endonuclease/exonuclease/phosphatase family protein [Neorhizobium galegae bv. orientalis]
MTDQILPAEAGPAPAQPLKTRHRLRILSYNVHSCIGTDRRLDPARVAEVIAALEPDIIGLQELDVGRSRTGGIDQAHAIASLLRMEFHFHAALNVAEERYGDAILTALPARMIKGAGLPSHGEQRGAVWVEIEVGEHKLQVFNTHLGLLGGDRMRQIGEILGPVWMGAPDCQGKPKILIGDFNATPVTATYKAVARQMADAPLVSGGRPKATFPSRLPLLRIDHVFVSSEVTPIATQVVSTPLSRRASDHLPLLVTVEL